jgi:hypothetical protein
VTHSARADARVRSTVSLPGPAPLAQSAQTGPASGVYRLTTRGQQGMSLDVSGWGNSDETAVDIWDWGGNAAPQANQQWLVEAQGDGTYKIYAYSGKNSLQMLDLTGGSTDNGTQVNTYEDNGNNAQLWYFQDTGGGWYRIIPVNAGANGSRTLEVVGGNGATRGARTDIYDYWGGDNQVWRLDYAGPQSIIANGKKGISGYDKAAMPTMFNASWLYTWGSDKPPTTPTGVEFVPMEWGYYGGDNSAWVQSVAAQPGVKNILGFNEPDHTDQANLSVSDALTGFQYLAAAGIPVGSPACADDYDSWFQQFMQGVTGQGLRLDFITVHCYLEDPYQFENYITGLHNWYWQYPLWITEFAPTDWASPSGVTTMDAANFMKIVVPWLNSQWYVARYAWYSGASPGTWTLGSAALVNTDGTPTDLGKLYSRM